MQHTIFIIIPAFIFYQKESLQDLFCFFDFIWSFNELHGLLPVFPLFLASVAEILRAFFRPQASHISGFLFFPSFIFQHSFALSSRMYFCTDVRATTCPMYREEERLNLLLFPSCGSNSRTCGSSTAPSQSSLPQTFARI